MIRATILGTLALASAFVYSLFFSTPMDAKTLRGGLHPDCNITMPCAPVTSAKPRSSREAHRIARADRYRNVEFGSPMYPPETARSFLGGDLVSKARQYIGSNPTGWRSLWCARFMAMIAPNVAARIKNPNWARAWASLQHVPPQVGAIAVLKRGKRGGHIGVVSGFDVHGNPIIVSGNHGRIVGEGVYSAKRVLAYVSAS